jgi:hypothetical protein
MTNLSRYGTESSADGAQRARSSWVTITDFSYSKLVNTPNFAKPVSCQLRLLSLRETTGRFSHVRRLQRRSVTVRSPPSLSKNPNGLRPVSAVIQAATHLALWQIWRDGVG